MGYTSELSKSVKVLMRIELRKSIEQSEYSIR